MEDTELFARAIAFAAEKHCGQVRKNGTPYIYHPMEVAMMIRDAGYGLKYQTAAVLHDVLEDTDATEDELREFGDDILEAVKLVTRPEGADEAVYVENILKNRMASVVKNADKIHNLWECVHPDAPGTRRKPEDIAFANGYIKKAKKYYSDKFSSALDMAIIDAEGEMTYINVRDTSWKCNNPAIEMELYSEQEARINSPEALAAKKAYLHKLYDEMPYVPDFDDANTCFAKHYYSKTYFCYVEIPFDETGGFSVGRSWMLCEAGWTDNYINLHTNWDDIIPLSRDEMLGIIRKKESEGYFYDFVEMDRVFK